MFLDNIPSDVTTTGFPNPVFLLHSSMGSIEIVPTIFTPISTGFHTVTCTMGTCISQMPCLNPNKVSTYSTLMFCFKMSILSQFNENSIKKKITIKNRVKLEGLLVWSNQHRSPNHWEKYVLQQWHYSYNARIGPICWWKILGGRFWRQGLELSGYWLEHWPYDLGHLGGPFYPNHIQLSKARGCQN